jgi:hypothetical protein
MPPWQSGISAANEALSFSIIDARTWKGRLLEPAGFGSSKWKRCYWMGVTVGDTVNGSAGGAEPPAATFCQIAPA